MLQNHVEWQLLDLEDCEEIGKKYLTLCLTNYDPSHYRLVTYLGTPYSRLRHTLELENP